MIKSVDHHERTITIELQGDIEELSHMQFALIDMIQQYSNPQENTLYWVMRLFEQLQPEAEQLRAAICNENQTIKLPNWYTENDRQELYRYLYEGKFRPISNQKPKE